ncbi:hypothetical protein COLO4_27926 [Corchorus olitorius]|uniref:Nodulin-related protein 1 n=1 Tax=Corchorus olitorius TaxID=93759 RepID=A0A1R3HNE8_9ROSI|nr:hypothetical protein COLO4_27926 [Corchorus olitorius]
MASEKDHKPTSSDLFSSAKVVADAAKSAFSGNEGGGDKFDKAKVAEAASDLLGAAKDYGKLEQDKGIGQYVDKAQSYLHQFESSQSTTKDTPAPAAAKDGEAKPESHPSGGHEGKESGSGGGVGDYMKMAQSFLGK